MARRRRNTEVAIWTQNGRAQELGHASLDAEKGHGKDPLEQKMRNEAGVSQRWNKSKSRQSVVCGRQQKTRQRKISKKREEGNSKIMRAGTKDTKKLRKKKNYGSSKDEKEKKGGRFVERKQSGKLQQ